MRQSIQIQVREREPSSELSTDRRKRVCHAHFDTRSVEASEGKSLRRSTTRAGGEGRTEGESSTGGGPTSRTQGLRVDKRSSAFSGYLPCLEEQRGCLLWRQHKREKVCRAGVFSFWRRAKSRFLHLLPSKCHHHIRASRSCLDRCYGTIVPHCPLKMALTSFSSRRRPISFINSVYFSSKCHGNLSFPPFQFLPCLSLWRLFP